MDLDKLVKENRQALKPVADAVAGASSFTLGLPCALVKEGTVISTTLTGLRGHLPTSVALASAPIEQFLQLRERVGFDAAFEAMTADDEVGEEFVSAWDEAHADLSNGVMCTINDLVAFIEQAKRGWGEDPQRFLVVARSGQTVTSGTVPTEWVLKA